jgi:aconitate hydratase
MLDPFGARTQETFAGSLLTYYRLGRLEELGVARIDRLPYALRILLEAALRQCDGRLIRREDVERIARWAPDAPKDQEIPFLPARILLQDFTGVPAVVDLAVMRDAMAALGGDPAAINPQVPVDLVIDHSVQVDLFGTEEALAFNMEREFERNEERYRFLHWAQKAFRNFRVVPPATGIVHQVNLEYLASVVTRRRVGDEELVFPDSLVGTDSHTTMVNGLGVLGWGVGGIEAEAGMLGQPLYFLLPDVVGVRLVGRLPEGATATDLALTVTQVLRQKGVVGKFVEFFGPGLEHMPLADRATVANMAPEYGATCAYFPMDAETLRYLAATGRSEEHVELCRWYLERQGLLRHAGAPDPFYSEVVEVDLSTLEPTLAGPKRPQDRVLLRDMKASFRAALAAPVGPRGFGLAEEARERAVTVVHPDGRTSELRNGAVVIAAITSCTNTSNPSVMIGAGLLAKKAVARGLSVPRYVKTSMAPGSKVVREYLANTGLLDDLEALGFAIVGYGCTTCIGNSGPLPQEVAQAVEEGDLTVAAVLSGNRNFEARIHPQVRANYLASPPLVVAYALAGTVDVDLTSEPLGHDPSGSPVYLRDLWPTQEEVQRVLEEALRPELFRRQYADVFTGNERWNAIQSPDGERYGWDPASTYIRRPPYFDGWDPDKDYVEPIRGARALLVLEDSVTTDHISPAGFIPPSSPAGRYLQEHGVAPRDFNSYGARRGNHEVMVRGTFANTRIRNQMVPGKEGGYTVHLPDGVETTVYEAAQRYLAEGVPLLVLAGKEYGTGSSRDWAAKGPSLLGVRAVLAQSFERIHRSNLVGMGVLPLEFQEGEDWRSLGITGRERFDLVGLEEGLAPLMELTVRALAPDGGEKRFRVRVRLDTAVEVEYYRHRGILQTVLGHLLRAGA